MNDRYDPEDLEALMSERAFEELLEEERRFVLRHVADREEYERMRRTLAYYRDADKDRPELIAGADVKRRVVEVFRARQHRPRYTVWLNMVRDQFLPLAGTGSWRPALAIAGVTLLLAVGVAYLQWWSPEDRSELAELKNLPSQEMPEAPEVRSEVPDGGGDEEVTGSFEKASEEAPTSAGTLNMNEALVPELIEERTDLLEAAEDAGSIADADIIANDKALRTNGLLEEEEEDQAEAYAVTREPSAARVYKEDVSRSEKVSVEVAAEPDRSVERAVHIDPTSASTHAELHVLLRKAL
ncbi:MAG: hypothetical protein KDB88_11120 [Flavobacteriales bacterium]|nr:hypothetical protein [Flavobacteriales bacterium]